MSFADDLTRFTVKVEGVTQDVFVNVVAATKSSITDGSPVTGSPGQPVGQYGPGYHQGKVGGELKASYHAEFETPTSALISTHEPYAEQNEDGIARPGGGSYTQRSTVGGRHSVALTIAGFQRLVDDEAKKVNA